MMYMEVELILVLRNCVLRQLSQLVTCNVNKENVRIQGSEFIQTIRTA